MCWLTPESNNPSANLCLDWSLQQEGFSADGTIITLDFPNAPKAAKASVSTFVVGHLAIQVVAIHPEPGHEDIRISVTIRPGPWEDLLSIVWPVGTRPVNWPPRLTFTNSGPISIGTLIARWRLG